MSTSRHLANLVDGHAAGPDGYVRLAIDASVWTALAAGCAAGLHDLCALWADGGAMRMALSDSGRGLRAIVSLPDHVTPMAVIPVGRPARRELTARARAPRQPQEGPAPRRSPKEMARCERDSIPSTGPQSCRRPCLRASRRVPGPRYGLIAARAPSPLVAGRAT